MMGCWVEGAVRMQASSQLSRPVSAGPFESHQWRCWQLRAIRCLTNTLLYCLFGAGFGCAHGERA